VLNEILAIFNKATTCDSSSGVNTFTYNPPRVSELPQDASFEIEVPIVAQALILSKLALIS